MKIQAIDWILYLVTFLLVCLGVVVIYSITYGQEATKNFAQYQIITAAIGIVFLILLSFIDYRTFKATAYLLYGVTLLFLFLLLTPLGRTYLGATRWLDLGFFQFQPSEFFKLVSIITLAHVCDKKELTLKDFIIALVLLFAPIILVIKQPDLGTSVILFLIGMTIIFVAGFSKKYLYSLVGILFIILVVFLLAFTNLRPINQFLKDYQKERILIFLNLKKDPFGAAYNVNQSRIAIGSGGILGRGLGFGPQSQLNFIPSKETDFVFSVASEGFGFLGASILISLFFVLFLRIIKVAHLAKDRFGTLLCFGILSYFLFEVFINIGMTMGILPVAGIPLPFISYGRTSLLVNLMAVGICQSVMIRHKKITF